MNMRFTRLAGAALVLGVSTAAVTACSSSTSSGGATTSAAGSGGAKKIALLLPETKTARYEAFDKPMFEAAVKASCSDCTVLYSNAAQDIAKQQQQAEAALTQGANVLVLDAVDGKAATTIVASAKSRGVPVVAYDRFVAGSDFYISFDNEKVGKLQGTGLVAAMKNAGKTSGDIVMINGSPTDANAADFKKGAHSVIDSSGYKVVAEYDTPDWSPDKAQQFMESKVASVKSTLVGVYAANDGTAWRRHRRTQGRRRQPAAAGDRPGRRAGRDPADPRGRPGPDDLQGDQARGRGRRQGRPGPGQQEPAAGLDHQRDAWRQSCSIPVIVTKDNVKDTVVKDGFYKVSDICTPDFLKACAAAALS